MDKPSYGTHDVGRFSISLAPPAGREHLDADDCEFFEVLVHERRGGIIFYVDLARDARFDWFGHLGKFEQRLTYDDLVEYNAVCVVRFHKNRHAHVEARASLAQEALVALQGGKQKGSVVRRTGLAFMGGPGRVVHVESIAFADEYPAQPGPGDGNLVVERLTCGHFFCQKFSRKVLLVRAVAARIGKRRRCEHCCGIDDLGFMDSVLRALDAAPEKFTFGKPW